MRNTQITIRGVPHELRRRLQELARETGMSLNQAALQALERGLSLSGEIVEHHDLDDLAGTWIEDPEFDRAIAEMDVPDAELWR